MPADPTDTPKAPSGPPPALGAELPATFSNQFYVAIYAGMMRITFGEQVYGGGETMYPRIAISMPIDRALDLSATILRIYQQVVAQQTPPTVGPSGFTPHVG